MKRNGLSPHELTTLNMIHINDSCILRTLSEGVGVESPAMNRIMNSLEKKKLVCRQKDSRDMRYTYFTLTRAGVELVEKATPEVQEVEDKVLLALTEDERKQLFSSLRKLL
nr:MarR family winged helix-turn-helix transcriptional regulator [Ruegeria sp. HKCCD8929]